MADREDFQIQLAGTDGGFACSPEDTLLRGALRHGVDLPYECNSGGCGSCKFDLVEGDVELLWEDPPGLSPRDRRKGRMLACQARPSADCTIKTRLSSDRTPIRPERFRATFVDRTDLAPDMAEFSFRAEPGPTFLPGQFVLVSLPGVEGDRAYSMSNAPQQDGNWRFIIKNMPDGAGSNYLFTQMRQGDVLSMDGPFGHAYLRQDTDRGVVLVAGGSGLSPVVSILRSMAANPAFADRPIHLFHGGRGPSDLCTSTIVDQLEDPTISVECHEAISDPDLGQDWDGRCCFVHELLPDVLGESFADYDYYFCGPPPMTEAVQRMVMVDYQVPFEQVHFDRFF